jgi:predicted ribosomally synthesized peptide with nif11-like leader
MTANNAKALVAKLGTDEAMAKDFAKAKSEADFLKAAKKHGYDVTLQDFTAELAKAKKAPKKKELSDKDLDQAAGGISIVAVDYAFVGIQTAKK